MSDIWLSRKEVCIIEKCGKATFYRHFKDGKYNTYQYVKSHRGKELVIALSCLSLEAQARYWDEREKREGSDSLSNRFALKNIDLNGLIKDNNGLIKDNNGLIKDNDGLIKDNDGLIKDNNQDFDSLPKYKKEEALWWLSVLNEFKRYRKKRKQNSIEDFVKLYRINHPDEREFGWRTLYRKINGYKEKGVLGLCNFHGKSRNCFEWSTEAKAWIWQKYLNINKPLATWCYEELRREAKANGWKIPSRRTVLRYLDGIPVETKIFYREGEKAWQERFLPSILRDYESIRPGEIYVADHAQINVAVRDHSGKIVFPWFTGWMDMRTRKILGWHLIEKNPSSDEINIALKHTIERFGVPEHIIIDNGRDFSSLQFSGKTKRFRFAINEQEQTGIYKLLGIKAHYCIPANARSKNIERFFWTQEMHFQMAFPAYRGNCTANRPEGVDKRIKEGQVLEWDDFKGCLSNYIELYNKEHQHTGHGMYGRTPDQVWYEYFIDNAQQKISASSLRLLMMKSKRLKVGRFGIRFLSNFYHEDTLMDYQQKDVVCRYDPDDLSCVYVYTDQDEYLCMAGRRHRTAWNDETAYKELKSLEKRRRKALREEREAAERIVQVKSGYTKHEIEGPVDNPKQQPKVIRMVRTPFDGTHKRIQKEKSRGQKRIAGDDQGDIAKRYSKRMAEGKAMREKKEEEKEREDLSRRFMRLSINDKVQHNGILYREDF